MNDEKNPQGNHLAAQALTGHWRTEFDQIMEKIADLQEIGESYSSIDGDGSFSLHLTVRNEEEARAAMDAYRSVRGKGWDFSLNGEDAWFSCDIPPL